MGRIREKSRLFRFKRFSVSHEKSAMKVGVDAVLLGAWARVDDCRRVLDIGTGCGIIALMMAQRNPEMRVDAVEIDAEAAEEAALNFRQSPWTDRLSSINCSFESFLGSIRKKESFLPYDLLVSNPPYFDSGIDNPVSPREIARHQGSLNAFTILECSRLLLCRTGRIALVLPSDNLEAIRLSAMDKGLELSRICYVRGHANKKIKRVLIELLATPDGKSTEESELILETSPGNPTRDYLALCRDFYLKF